MRRDEAMSELQQGMQAFQSTPESWTRSCVVEEAGPILSHEDPHIVRRALIGDSNALSTLFTRYGERLYRTSFTVLRNKEDAEDALQDGLLSAYMNLRSFEGRSQFATWLTHVVMNAALMKRRRLRTRLYLSLDEFDATRLQRDHLKQLVDVGQVDAPPSITLSPRRNPKWSNCFYE